MYIKDLKRKIFNKLYFYITIEMKDENHLRKKK